MLFSFTIPSKAITATTLAYSLHVLFCILILDLIIVGHTNADDLIDTIIDYLVDLNEIPFEVHDHSLMIMNETQYIDIFLRNVRASGRQII